MNDSVMMKISTATENELNEISNAITRRRQAIREKTIHEAARMVSDVLAFMDKNHIGINVESLCDGNYNPGAISIDTIVGTSIFNGIVYLKVHEDGEDEDEDEDE